MAVVRVSVRSGAPAFYVIVLQRSHALIALIERATRRVREILSYGLECAMQAAFVKRFVPDARPDAAH